MQDKKLRLELNIVRNFSKIRSKVITVRRVAQVVSEFVSLLRQLPLVIGFTMRNGNLFPTRNNIKN